MALNAGGPVDDKPTPGRRIIASLERIGFAGRIFPVNPNYPSVLNRPCYASPAELPEAPDIAVFCLDHERVFSAFEAAAKRGMKAAVIYAGGFAEQGAEGRVSSASRRVSPRTIKSSAVRFAADSPLEGGVYCELVSEVGLQRLANKARFQGVYG